MVKKKKVKEKGRDRVVKFSFRGKGVDSKITEIVAYPEGTSDEDIQEEFDDWLYGRSLAYWADVEGEE